MKSIGWLLIASGMLALLVVVAMVGVGVTEPAPVCPGPDCPQPAPDVPPAPVPAPKKPRRPWGPRPASVEACEQDDGDWIEWRRHRSGNWGLYDGSRQLGYYSLSQGRYWPLHAGVWGKECDPPVALPTQVLFPLGEPAPAVDVLAMPAEHRRRNINARGLGCCTFRSADYAAHWQNVPALYGLPEWLRDKGYAGGGAPTKQAEIVNACAADRKMPAPAIDQYQGPNPAPVIELLLRTGRLPCVTWGGNHMLNCVHLDTQWCGIVDNNDPGRVQWLKRDQGLRRITQGGGGWVFSLRAPPPPPPPANVKQVQQARDDDMVAAANGMLWLPGGAQRQAPSRRPRETAARVPRWRPRRDGLTWKWDGRERYSSSGTGCTQGAFVGALEDDSKRLHITVIGTQQQRQQARADLKPLESTYLVQDYDPSDWAVQAGFVKTGKPGPCVQLQRRADQSGCGAVLWRTEAWDASQLTELRRADPNYRPGGDPGPGRTPAIGGEVPLAAVGVLGGGSVLALLGALALRRRSRQPLGR